jgi:hypothetical protein
MTVQRCFALGLVGLSLAPLALSQNVLSINKVPGRIESTAQQLTHSLETQGYEVLRGYFKLMTKDDCELSYNVMHTCYGNNPAAPYVVPIVPPWPDQPGPGEWVDPETIGALGPTVDGYNATYRLDPHEAIVILVQMPPPATFFSEKTYLFTRVGSQCFQSSQYSFVQTYMKPMLGTFFSVVPKEPERVELIADLTNNPNSVIMANQSGRFWEQPRYFVITPNPAMDTAVRRAFAKVGIEGQFIFTEKIPSYIGSIPDDNSRNCADAANLRFGLDRQADDFVTVLRYAMPMDETAADRWRQRLPLVVLRIRNLAAEEQTYPWEPFDPRTPSVPPETWYNEPPQNYLDKLTEAVCDSWNKPANPQNCTRWQEFLNSQAGDMQTPGLMLTGPACIPDWMNCIAPSEDSTYLLSGKLLLEPDHFYAVAGPLSTATNNALYVGLGLNMSKEQLGFYNLSQDDLKDTAKGYTQAVPSDKFFVYYFARDCSILKGQLPEGLDLKCYDIGDQLPYCTDVANPDCNMLVLTMRGYIRPGTHRATDKDSVLKSRFIYLKIPKK